MSIRTSFNIVPIALIVFSLTCAGQTINSKPETLSTSKRIEPVILTTTVIDKKGGLVTGLRPENFRIVVDKEPADIIDFRGEDLPLSAGIVFDASASVFNPDVIKAINQGLQLFFERSSQSNHYFLIAFNTKPQLLLDWTSNTQDILKTVSLFRPYGQTALYDACYLAIDKLRQGRNSKRVLILISDGQDNLSAYSREQVLEEIKASGVLVYSLNLSSLGFWGNYLALEGQEVLEEFSLTSGGMSFSKAHQRYLKKSQIVGAFELLAEELRHQYNIAVSPTALSSNNKWHKVKVTVQAPGLKVLSVRTRKGFYLDQ